MWISLLLKLKNAINKFWIGVSPIGTRSRKGLFAFKETPLSRNLRKTPIYFF